MYDFGPLKVHNCSVEVFNKLLKVNPEADMRAIPNQWLLEARALNQSLSDRIDELEAKVERMKDALTAISTALDAYGVDYCRGTAKAALEEKENES